MTYFLLSKQLIIQTSVNAQKCYSLTMYGVTNCEEGLIYKLLILNIYQTLIDFF